MQEKHSRKIKKKKKTGDVVEIEARENEFCYGRVLNLAAFAFYDALSKGRLEGISEVINLPVIFKVPVIDYAIVLAGEQVDLRCGAKYTCCAVQKVEG